MSVQVLHYCSAVFSVAPFSECSVQPNSVQISCIVKIACQERSLGNRIKGLLLYFNDKLRLK